jgi:hypothetical protein
MASVGHRRFIDIIERIVMDMKVYLESTSDALSPMFNSIRDSSSRLLDFETSIHHWVHLENYLVGNDHKGWGQKNFDDWKKDMGEEPTIESVQFWRAKLESMAEARRETVNILCASILMIAQNGVKHVLGQPALWKAHEGKVLSSQNECVLSAIWHGRNLGAHVEGLKTGTPSFDYFENVKTRRGLDLGSPSSGGYPCKYIVKDLLGWIELHDLPVKDTLHTESYTPPYVQDMMRLGALANAT